MAACFFKLASRALSRWFPRDIFTTLRISVRNFQISPHTGATETLGSNFYPRVVEDAKRCREGLKAVREMQVWEWPHSGRFIGFKGWPHGRGFLGGWVWGLCSTTAAFRGAYGEHRGTRWDLHAISR